ncbi:MAG TPA: hypothetical protein VN830_05190 [Verrucomicrobiae bacterium]|nr:hypothetical protein [Verrucomicrobiae bacterium]
MKRLLQRRIGKLALVLGAITAAMALVGLASAKKKEKVLLPDYVLTAQTVAVFILPETGEPMTDPFANRKAQEEVEKAIMKWGRFRLTQEAFTADLVIGVRKGTGKIMNPTISGGPVDSRPGTIETTDNQVRIGMQQGRPPNGTQTGEASGRTSPGMEAGSITEDLLQVFRGGDTYAANSAPVWTYSVKDGLNPPGVAAVEKFRKTLEEAEKAAAQKQQQSQQQGQKKNP